MVSAVRKHFNQQFSQEKYRAMLKELDDLYPGAIEFRLAETPVFVPKDFTQKMIGACESIIDLIIDPSFMDITAPGIPQSDKVGGRYGFPQMIAFDFGVCINEESALEPQLIEMQGFPSLYAFQVIYPDVLRKHFDIPNGYTQFLNNHNRETYTRLFKKIILGNHQPENVILLEIKPHEQKTRVDFYGTRDLTGIEPVCLTELIKEGKQLFYILNGKKTRIHRIYNRVIFDELHSRKDLGHFIDIREELDVEWVPHPDWFYRVSKYTLPFISHPYVPETFFLNEVMQLPSDLQNFVLKPLFSFAGQGVIIDVTPGDILNVRDPHNWILQRKVNYKNVVETPDIPAKTEIRIMYLWEDGAPRPQPAINLARLSKGKMIGTRYNKDKEWVGGSVAFFEP
ncbi:MAG: hypothetical protein JNK79_08445 [Chitinophagaceae bacterium]|nr:hypothetical protein [Chitinophagaceae bacterium]